MFESSIHGMTEKGGFTMFRGKVVVFFVLFLAFFFALTGSPSVVKAKSGELVVAEGAEIGQLDPHRARSVQDFSYGDAIFDGLYQRHDGEISNGLAESHKLINNTTWEFKLRKGVRFHNGDSLTAKDVKFSIDRLVNPATNNPISSLYLTIDKVAVVDDYTVVITTKKPDPLLLKRLALTAWVVPASYIEKIGIEEYLKKPIGTGPFKFVRWVKNDNLTLEANKDYWGGAPKLNRVVIKSIPEASSRVAALETGEADIVSNIPPFLIPQLKSKSGIEIQSVLSGRIMLVQLNTRENGQAPLKNLKVRQALNYAVDKKLIIEKVLMGSAVERANLLTNYHFGFDPNVKPYPYDPQKAKKLLTEAGYGDGFQLDFACPIGRYLMDKEVSEAICGMLNKVGVKTDLKVMEWGNFLKTALGRQFQGAYFIGWGNMFDDADGTYSNFWIEEAAVNIYKTPVAGRVEKLTREAIVEMDKEKRQKMYSEIQKLTVEDAAMIFLYQLKDNYGVRNRVKGFKARGDEKIGYYGISVD